MKQKLFGRPPRKNGSTDTYNGIESAIQTGTGGPGVGKVLLAGPVDTSSRHRVGFDFADSDAMR